MLDIDEIEVLKTTQAITSSDEIRQILDGIVEGKPSYDSLNNNYLKENNDPEVELVKRSGLEAVNGGWSQNEEGLVTLIFKVPGMNKDLRENVCIDYQNTSVVVRMKNIRGCDYEFTVPDLCEDIIPDKCFFSIKKKNELIVRLKKLDRSFNWESLVRQKMVKDDIEYLIIRKELNKILNDTKISTVIKRQLSESLSNAGHLHINSTELATAALNLLKTGTSDVMTAKVKSVHLSMESDAQVYQDLVSHLAHTHCLVSLVCRHEGSWKKHQLYLKTLLIGRCKVIEFTGYLTPQFSCAFPPDIKNLFIRLKKASHSSLFTNVTIPETVKNISISIPSDADPQSLSTFPILGKGLRLVFKGLTDSDLEWMLSCIGKTVGISKEDEYARLFWLVLENCHMSFVGLMAISSMLLPKAKLVPLFPFGLMFPMLNSSNEVKGVTDGSQPLPVTALNCHSMLGVAVDLQNAGMSEETKEIIGNHFRQMNCPFLCTIDF